MFGFGDYTGIDIMKKAIQTRNPRMENGTTAVCLEHQRRHDSLNNGQICGLRHHADGKSDIVDGQ